MSLVMSFEQTMILASSVVEASREDVHRHRLITTQGERVETCPERRQTICLLFSWSFKSRLSAQANLAVARLLILSYLVL